MTDETFNKTQVITLIKQLTGQANLLTTPILFVKALGDMNSAVLLGQILYWQDKGARDDGFFWKSRKGWNDELGLSTEAMRRATRILKTASCGLETKVMKANGSPTLHYRLDKETFLAWTMAASTRLAQMDLLSTTNGNVVQPKTLTETTSESINSNNSTMSSSPSSKKTADFEESALPKTEKRKAREKVLEPVH